MPIAAIFSKLLLFLTQIPILFGSFDLVSTNIGIPEILCTPYTTGKYFEVSEKLKSTSFSTSTSVKTSYVFTFPYHFCFVLYFVSCSIVV